MSAVIERRLQAPDNDPQLVTRLLPAGRIVPSRRVTQ
jgi:hypothetical protein